MLRVSSYDIIRKILIVEQEDTSIGISSDDNSNSSNQDINSKDFILINN
ncbi:14774_t:CDS:2 [Gigaspora margarita]|uniref:14774_t:CDS:1 n=1 Tax=Gigaspora margarita TaxID=4874 RepID=A0ABN7UJW5_GIGMA|nr:14774_t:CDS:2 [Gigaspora margarita]